MLFFLFYLVVVRRKLLCYKLFLLYALVNGKNALSLHYQNVGHRRVSFGKEIYYDKYMGKSYTASSLRILQGLTAAKVVGCSGAM